MTVKAAYFRVVGFSDSHPITPADLDSAVSQGAQLQVPWPKKGKWHNIRAWAELLVKTRASTPGIAYAAPNFGIEIQMRGQRLEVLWSETLRYHKNVAYPHEVRRAREIAEWLLVNALQL
jgi:hypothetical protein